MPSEAAFIRSMMISAGPLSRSFVRLVAVVPVLASLTVVGAAARVGPPVAGCAQAATLHHAALVVEHGDTAVVTVCVPFSEDSITGAQLLARSGVEYATADYGGTGLAVCQVGAEPAQYPPSCWTASSPYWAMYVSRSDGSWTFSSLGISSQTFRDGDAEGFRYEGQSDYSLPPSPRGVCPVATPPTLAPTPVPSARPAPRRMSQPAAPPSSRPSGVPAAVVRASPSPTAPEASSPLPTAAATARATTATLSPTPRSQPPFPSTGGWAATGLGVALVGLLVFRVVRPRRRWGHARVQGGMERP